MNLSESVISALHNLAAHKLRSLLTMLGMIFGVGAVIAMLSIGSGAELQAMDMIDRMGLRNVLVRNPDLADDELNEIRMQSLGVSLRDATIIEDGVPGVELTAPRVEVDTYMIMAPGAHTEGQLIGVSNHQDELSGLRVAEGRFIDAIDDENHAQVAVIGAGIRRNLFGSGDAIGKHLKVNDTWFEVIGVLEESGGGSSFQGVAIGTTSTEIYAWAKGSRRRPPRSPSSACSGACTAAPTTSTWWFPRRSWSKVAARSGSSTSSWAVSPASRCWSAASAS